MKRREFLKGVVAAAVVVIAPIPRLGPRVQRFYEDHFVVGDYIRVSGGLAENNGLYVVTEMRAGESNTILTEKVEGEFDIPMIIGEAPEV